MPIGINNFGSSPQYEERPAPGPATAPGGKPLGYLQNAFKIAFGSELPDSIGKAEQAPPPARTPEDDRPLRDPDMYRFGVLGRLHDEDTAFRARRAAQMAAIREAYLQNRERRMNEAAALPNTADYMAAMDKIQREGLAGSAGYLKK